ncbi:EamA family transporter [Paenibacillus illinoisensis]|uniref:Drug-metabolite exporter family protein n=1 Tax=Paenibacillus illinoisensis TaxID=59845 RepID=A0A2W0C8S6_9BACL|nr:DMT family transporter [Paenibacillus illinoisensis]PYY26442.1 Drug-metabolite exporter family protein [Paenibacillus illinoisensis]
MKYYLSVLAGAMSYGILSTIVVLAYGEGYQLGEVVGSQLVTGFILSWLLALYTKFKTKRRSQTSKTAEAATRVFTRLTWKQRLLLMAAGTPTVITGLVYYQSLRYIPASLAIILLFQFTWISVLIQAVSKRQRPDKVTFLTLIILFGGTLLAAGFLEQGLSEFNGLGIALGLMAAVSYSLFVLFSGKAVPSAHPAFRSAWMVTGGLILLCILFPPTFLFNGLIWSQLLVFGLLLGFFGAFIPPVLFAIGVPHIGGDMAGILGAVELPVAVLLSSIVLHEHVSGLQWFGVIIVLIGVALPELYKLRLKRSRSAPQYSS